MASAKTSKNSKKGSKKVVEYIKKVRPKKSEILIEITDEVMCNIRTNEETGLVEEYLDKKVLKVTKKFGKHYLLCSNI